MSARYADTGRLLKAVRAVLDNYEGVGPVGDCTVYIWDLDELKAAYVEMAIEEVRTHNDGTEAAR